MVRMDINTFLGYWSCEMIRINEDDDNKVISVKIFLKDNREITVLYNKYDNSFSYALSNDKLIGTATIMAIGGILTARIYEYFRFSINDVTRIEIFYKENIISRFNNLYEDAVFNIKYVVQYD
jgi:hypothetical protein